MLYAGTIAKANIGTRSWLQTPINKDTSKTKKTRGNECVVHQIFADCASIAVDTLWQSVFTAASKGKFPKNFGYKDNVLFFRRKNKTLSAAIPENRDEAYEICRAFFQNMGGIVSDKPVTQIPINKEREKLTWSKITRKKNRTLYINAYILKFAANNGLNKAEVEQTRKLLNLIQALELLNDNNVTFNEDVIVDIHELYFDPANRVTTFEKLRNLETVPHDDHKKGSKSKHEAPVGLFVKLWDKYLNSFDSKKKGHKGDSDESSDAGESID